MCFELAKFPRGFYVGKERVTKPLERLRVILKGVQCERVWLPYSFHQQIACANKDIVPFPAMLAVMQ